MEYLISEEELYNLLYNSGVDCPKYTAKEFIKSKQPVEILAEGKTGLHWIGSFDKPLPVSLGFRKVGDVRVEEILCDEKYDNQNIKVFIQLAVSK